MRAKENTHPLLDVGGNRHKEGKDWGTQCLCASGLTVRAAALLAPSTLSWDAGQGAERRLHNPGGNSQWPATPLRPSHIHGVGWDKSKSTEGEAHQTTSHHLLVVLVNWGDSSQLESWLREMGLFKPGEKKPQGQLIALYNCLRGGHSQVGASLFSVTNDERKKPQHHG